MEESVKLIALTKPVADDMLDFSVQDFIGYVARVSNPGNQLNTETTEKLLKYLLKNKHYSPFEMVNVVMEINTTRDIPIQILRHRSFSFQEFSQRYANPTVDLGFTAKEARLQDKKNRQNSIENSDLELNNEWQFRQLQLVELAKTNYKWAVDHGLAKEVARVVLPEGLTNSRLYMNGSLRSWIHYCLLRMGNGTQKEHREIALECWNVLCEKFEFLKIIELEDTQH